MKKSFYHILLLSALTLGTTSSCDDYLEVDHYDILPEDFMYQNETNIKSGLYGIYDTFYTYQGSDNSGDDTTWGFKPNVFIAGHSTMDCQASGWDAEWQRHAVLANKGSLDTAWRMSYKAIDRANRFLAGLQNVDVSVLSAEKKVQFQKSLVLFLCCLQVRLIQPVQERRVLKIWRALIRLLRKTLSLLWKSWIGNLPMENTVVLLKVSARHFWLNSICIRRNSLRPRRS